jgi:hypothetical protein
MTPEEYNQLPMFQRAILEEMAKIRRALEALNSDA